GWGGGGAPRPGGRVGGGGAGGGADRGGAAGGVGVAAPAAGDNSGARRPPRPRRDAARDRASTRDRGAGPRGGRGHDHRLLPTRHGRAGPAARGNRVRTRVVRVADGWRPALSSPPAHRADPALPLSRPLP